MESVLSRYKNLIVLVGILFAQVLGLAVQVKRTSDTESSRLIRIWAVSAVTPFERAFNRVQNGTWNVWHNYFYLRGVRAENRELKHELEQLRLDQVRLSEDAEQARRLQSLLGFKEQYIEKTLPSQVIGSSGSELSRSVFIDKGEKDGVRADMAVITADGIVGKVLKVFRSTSQILLIDDQSSGVGGILEKSRLQGIVRGTAGGEVVLERVMSDEQVKPGEQVLTSGGDSIFPKGLPVGTVTKVSPGQELFLNIRLRPAANLAKLEEVLVVTHVVEKQPEAGAGNAVRAVDILAQRLPSVPDKPAEDANNPNKVSEAPEGTSARSSATAAAPRASATKPVPGAPMNAQGLAETNITQGVETPRPEEGGSPTAAQATKPAASVKPPANAKTPAASATAAPAGSAAATGTVAKPAGKPATTANRPKPTPPATAEPAQDAPQ
jgi:rod shape-determining protein MreC